MKKISKLFFLMNKTGVAFPWAVHWSAPYHPQSSGQTECFVDTFKRALLKANEVEQQQKPTKYISLFASNNTKWSSEKWNDTSRSTHKDKSKAHSKIKQKHLWKLWGYLPKNRL